MVSVVHVYIADIKILLLGHVVHANSEITLRRNFRNGGSRDT